MRAERVLVASVPFLRAIGTSSDLRLRLERPSPDAPRAPKITGTVFVDKALYTGEFVVEGAEIDPALMPTTSPDWMADLRIRAQDQARISNASAELRVLGDVDLVRDTAGLRLRGTVEIPQGRVPLFNNDFTITEGSLDFSRRPLEPEIDIRAETEVPIYDPTGQFGRELERIEVHLTGTFAQPQVTFTSENGLDEITILRLLAGFRPSESGEGESVGFGDLGLRAGLNLLERALAQRIRGVDTIDIETEEAGIDQMESTRIAVGKYLSNSVYLRFSQGLSVTERDLFLEYQISRRTLFTSELKRRLRETGAENEFNLDLKFRVKY
jgi:autotransporter translocation and assembly factor TamB